MLFSFIYFVISFLQAAPAARTVPFFFERELVPLVLFGPRDLFRDAKYPRRAKPGVFLRKLGACRNPNGGYYQLENKMERSVMRPITLVRWRNGGHASLHLCIQYST